VQATVTEHSLISHFTQNPLIYISLFAMNAAAYKQLVLKCITTSPADI